MVARKLVVVVSGIPASGKSTVARQVAPILGVPIVDEDELLEASFPANATLSPADRQRLSREADVALQRIVEASPRAVVASFWRRPELSATSGTPTDWLQALAPVIEVHCVCEPSVAADRFVRRTRHAAHGDARKDRADLLVQFRAMDALGPLGIGQLVSVRTDTPVDPAAVARLVETVL